MSKLTLQCYRIDLLYVKNKQTKIRQKTDQKKKKKPKQTNKKSPNQSIRYSKKQKRPKKIKNPNLFYSGELKKDKNLLAFRSYSGIAHQIPNPYSMYNGDKFGGENGADKGSKDVS